MTSQSDLIRMPAVAGRFYPAEPGVLARDVDGFLRDGAPQAAAGCSGEVVRAAGVVSPHAGYMYSGGVAGKVFAGIHVPERVVVLCPNHTGKGARISVITEGAYRLPGGDVPVDEELAAAILREVPGAQGDRAAHQGEHAIEVQLPFLMARQPRLSMVPIVLSGLGEAEALQMGHALHRAIAAVEGHVLVVASSDMSHFETDAEARRLDHMALKPLLASDPSGLYRTVMKHDISMCGVIPATVMLAYTGCVAAKTPRLVGYATSGDACGDRSSVVGYAGVVIPA